MYRTVAFPMTWSDFLRSRHSSMSRNLENGTRYSYTYNGRPTESHIWSIKWCHFQWP